MPEFTEYAPGTPCWVDVASPDLDRTITFYSELFGWESTEDTRREAGGYTMLSKDGKYVAAAGPSPQEGMPSAWTTYIASDDVDATAGKIRDAGGTLLMEPFDVFDSGRMAVAQDPTGAVFGIWQAGEHHGAQLANEPGSFTWNEVQTPDVAAAEAFYRAVFHHELEQVPMGDGMTYGVLKVNGKSVGGLYELKGDMAGMPPHWATAFAVADTDATCKLAEGLGGSVLVQPLDIPAIGRYAVIQDPVGAVFQVLADPPS